MQMVLYILVKFIFPISIGFLFGLINSVEGRDVKKRIRKLLLIAILDIFAYIIACLCYYT